MRALILFLMMLCAGPSFAAERAPAPKPAGPIGFDQIIEAALADVRSLPAGAPARTRYLCASNEANDPAALERTGAVVGGYQVNSLSREPDIRRARQVTPWLWAIDTDDYGPAFATAWEAFAADNPYFTIKVQIPSVTKELKRTVTDRVKKVRQVLRYDQYQRGYYAPEDYYEEVSREVVETVAVAGPVKETFIPAPWLPTRETAALVLLTGSSTPIVFADQFFDRTAIQKGRTGNGYRDFLGLQKDPTLKDLYELTGFDRGKSIKARKEVAAIVLKSGVARFPRQAFREVALTGGFWRTKDTDDPKANGNAVDRLFEAFEFKAQEIIAPLPNGLVVTELADQNDQQQDAAPNAIVGNRKSADNDFEIHVGTVTCFVCHGAALIKVRDSGRAKYSEKTGITLEVVDPATRRRAHYAYLTGDFADEYESDQKRFDRKYREASGLDTPALAKAVAEQWRAYHVDAVTLKKAAARAGVTPDALRTALRRHVTLKKAAGVPADEVLGYFLLDDEDEQPVPIELFEERFPVLMLILQGANP